jgi:hypothetical protein
MHLHPKDVPGAIVSIDQPDPPQSWRWAGPSWIGGTPDGVVGGVRRITVCVPDPVATAERWAAVLGETARADGDRATIALDEAGQRVDFVPMSDTSREGICEIVVAASAGHGQSVTIGGAAFTLEPL